MISVVMPLYNNEREVGRAISSVLNQTYRHFELIVVNDGSTDTSVVKVQSYHDQRIVVAHQKNQGVSAARNTGIRLAKNDIIAFLDADDEWMSNFLETIVSLSTQFPECSVFAANYIFHEESGTQRNTVLRGISSASYQGLLQNYFEVASQSDPPLWSSAIAVRKNAIESVGGFPVGITSGEDLLTWARIAVRYSIAYTNLPCAVFHLKAPLAGTPSRIPQEPDVVGSSLAELLETIRPAWKKSLKKYIALWHRMRAAMFLGLQQRSKTLREVRYSIWYHPLQLRTYLYAFLALLPAFLRMKFYRVFSYLKTEQRGKIS